MNELQSIRNFICFNQKELIQYEFILSEQHKKLRQYKENSIVDSKELSSYIDDLLGVAYGDLLNVFHSNKKLISELFKSIGISEDIRMTVKTLEDGSVLDFFRSHSKASLETSSIESNTGFSSIMGSSKIMNFLSNDLEEDFKNNQYSNPRLNADLRQRLIKNEIKWEECWSALNENSKETPAYRSTLIIPLAIRIEDNDKELFIKKFSKSISHAEGSRTVWGFLCFDSQNKNIFLNKEDELKNMGYIVADILSLYLMFFYNHISGSDTFNWAISTANLNDS